MATKVALVTGASSGIGEATALKLKSLGYRVYAAARRIDRMRHLTKSDIKLFAMDVTGDASMQAGIDAIIAEAGRVDVLVNNAGYGSYRDGLARLARFKRLCTPDFGWGRWAGFYLQTKGRIEESVNNLGFERFDLIRPGFLIGGRSERRVLETIGQHIFATLTPVLLGPLARYGVIRAETVADAIVALVGMGSPGPCRHENSGLRLLSAKGR